MRTKERTTLVHNIFLVSIVIKGVDGLLELIGGVFLLFFKNNALQQSVQFLFQHELSQDPTDTLARSLVSLSQKLSMETVSFIAVYLVLHGLIKLGLVAGLWYEKKWIFPLAGVVLTLFVVYQLMRFASNHSLFLLILAILDILILVLLRFEYQRLTRAKK
ncbi:MAG: DUF2127 domain-containing protein [Candidatus Woesearchaeota archaeon]|nr:MAG: DUF2127 domain-containing protein [Candidatus Woesearchaeota archaeon]